MARPIPKQQQPAEYTRNQLKVLWHLKRNGPLVNDPPTVADGILRKMSGELDIRVKTVGYILRQLEEWSLVLRTYRKGGGGLFGAGTGPNQMTRCELIDPGMWLPELPAPLTLGQVMRNENRDLDARTAQVPTEERTIVFLLDRNEELQSQIDKLCQVVKDQAAENETLKAQVARLSRPAKRHVSDHLSQRVADALGPEKWAELQHPPIES